jgi:hypothetical protein
MRTWGETPWFDDAFHDPRTPMGKVIAAITPPFTILRGFLRKLLRS